MRALVIVGTLLLAGCNNACQATCVRMAAFAEECGYTVSDSQLSECISDQANVDADARKTCAQSGDSVSIRKNWSCDELEPYWGAE